MLLLLSCAKTMGKIRNEEAPTGTSPLFDREARDIAMYMSQFTVSDLEQALHVNPKIAVESFRRYQNFHDETNKPVQSLLTYTGIVFKRIKPQDFTQDDFQYAQQHLLITSFCYGLLRPLDLIKQYRLEGEVRIPQLEGITMFDYWKPKLTDLFIERIKQAGGILVDLASEEMKSLFHWSQVKKEVKIITPEFKTWRNGKPTSIVIYTKMARGEMTRYLLKNRFDNPEDLKSFEWEGCSYHPELSDEKTYTFVM